VNSAQIAGKADVHLISGPRRNQKLLFERENLFRNETDFFKRTRLKEIKRQLTQLNAASSSPSSSSF
jgi:hypothetical protein